MATAKGRCNLFFYFVGLLHLGMGLVMQAGVAGHAALLPAWVQRQPALACALGVLLMGLGVLARSDARRFRQLARWGLGLYVAAAVVNSLGLVASFRTEGVALAAAALAGGGLIMGSFLGTVLLTCTGGKHHA